MTDYRSKGRTNPPFHRNLLQVYAAVEGGLKGLPCSQHDEVMAFASETAESRPELLSVISEVQSPVRIDKVATSKAIQRRLGISTRTANPIIRMLREDGAVDHMKSPIRADR